MRLPLQAVKVGNQFYENMELYDPKDKEDIEWGLKRVFSFDQGNINRAIAAQVSRIFIAAQVKFGLMSVQVDWGSPSIYPSFIKVSLLVNHFADNLLNCL